MKCSVYIATSADGYIATTAGEVDWLHTAGNLEADMKGDDMGFQAFMDSVDCMVMGRNCMETIANMNLTAEQWPYGNIRIVVLSKSVTDVPESLTGRVEIYAGSITDLVTELQESGLKHAYVDGGATITSFINLGLIEAMIITKAPVLLGEGIPLFGKLNQKVKLENAQAKTYSNEFIQIKYHVNYS